MSNLIGQSLGRYHILEQLGEGGMAIVYKAYDTRLERDVAVKVIRTEKLTIETMGKTLKRFEREAKALAKLTHPNIVPTTDYGEHDEKPYLVMPYLPGGTLKQKLGKPIPWEDSVRLLIPVARALHYAHQQGIIHRDVKPANILITQSGEPMLTDFGIAKILLDTEETADLTGTGMGVGTPEYMSPEQFQGKGVDARTDVYSLGVVLYEMVTGRKPYQADTPAAVLIKQATEALPRPRSFVPGLPEEVEKILLKAMAKEKENRYQDVSKLIEHLENSLMGISESRNSTVTPKKSRPEEPNLDTQDTFEQGETCTTNWQAKTYDESPHKSPVTKSQHSPVTQQKKIIWWPWAVGILGVVCFLLVGVISIGSGISRKLFTFDLSGTSAAPETLVATEVPAATEALAVNLPVLQGTPYPPSSTVISSENINQISNLAQWKGKGQTIAFSPSGTLMAAASGLRSTIEIIGVSDGVTLNTLIGHINPVSSVAFSPNGQILASGSMDNTIRLWQVSDGVLLQTLGTEVSNVGNRDTAEIWSVAFSPNGSLLASGSIDGVVQIWQVSNGFLLHTIKGHKDAIPSVTFSPDGGILASGSWDTTVKLWRVSDGTLLSTLAGHTNDVMDVRFSPDGSMLASGSRDSTIRLWRVIDGSLLQIFSENTDWVEDIDFSPDSKLLASATTTGPGDGVVKLWRVSDGLLQRILERHSRPVISVTFSPDGTLLVYGLDDETLLLWGIAP